MLNPMSDDVGFDFGSRDIPVQTFSAAFTTCLFVKLPNRSITNTHVERLERSSFVGTHGQLSGPTVRPMLPSGAVGGLQRVCVRSHAFDERAKW